MINSSSPQMFDQLTVHYDRMNHLFSLGIDILWRNMVAKMVQATQPKSVLDLATGSGDLLLAIIKKHPCQITGLDYSKEMLDFAFQKWQAWSLSKPKPKKQGTDHSEITPQFLMHDVHNLPFVAESFDGITCSFGIRNFYNLDQVVSECFRVLKKKGSVFFLELTIPSLAVVKPLFLWYLMKVMPRLTGWFLGRKEEYNYLANSVRYFNDRVDVESILKNHGFIHVKKKPLSLGICTLWIGEKSSLE